MTPGPFHGAPLTDLLLLLGLLLALSGPLPQAVARWGWTRASPRQGILLWIAVSWAWVLSLVGVVLTVTLAPLGLPLVPALVVTVVDIVGPGAVPATVPAGLAAAGLVAVVLPGAAVLLWARDARRGHAHAGRLALVGSSDERGRVIAVPGSTPTALTLPAWGRGVVVVTRAWLEDLPGAEREAVLAHERAHAAGHHHVVRAWFAAWRLLAPVPGAKAAQAAVDVLLEVAADRAAMRAVGPVATASALFTRCAPASGAGPWQPRPETLARLRTLARSGATPPLVRASLPTLATVLLVLPGLVLGRA